VRILTAFVGLLLVGCSTFGIPPIKPVDFGPPGEFVVCLRTDPPIQWAEGRQLMLDSWEPYAAQYNLRMKVLRHWPKTLECRHHFRLRAPSWAGVGAGWIFGPLGATRNDRVEAWAYAQWMGPNHGLGPEGVIAHEIHHLLGCNHGLFKANCHNDIRRYKLGIQRAARASVLDPQERHEAGGLDAPGPGDAAPLPGAR
jgi:hypothetical protein